MIVNRFIKENTLIGHFVFTIYYIGFLFMILLCFSCTSNRNEKLVEAEKKIETDPDSSIQILQSIQNEYSSMNDEEKALFGLLFFQAAAKSDTLPSDHEMIDFSIQYYIQKNQKQALSNAYYCKAKAYKQNRDYAEAIQYLLKSLDLIDKKDTSDLKGNVYFDLGHISAYQGEFVKGLNYLEKAVDYFELTQKKESMLKVYTIMGDISLANEEFDNAIRMHRKVLQIGTTDSLLIGNALNSIGNSYFYKDEIDSALYYTKKSIDYPYTSTNLAMRYYNIANIYSYIKEFDQAAYYINKAFEYPIDIYIEEECYRIRVRIALAKEDHKNAEFYIKKRTNCQDSIKKIEHQTNVNVLEQLHQSDKITMKVKNQLSVLAVTASCITLGGGAFFMILYKRNRKKQHLSNQYKEELEKNHQILEKKNELLGMKHDLLLQELISDLERTRKKYSEERRKTSFSDRDKIDKKIYEEVLHFDKEEVFQEKMNTLLNYLPEKLKSSYPNISYKEIVWSCLFILEIPNTDIAIILDYKQGSLYKFKQRFGKKLGFASLKELELMLQNKVAE